VSAESRVMEAISALGSSGNAYHYFNVADRDINRAWNAVRGKALAAYIEAERAGQLTPIPQVENDMLSVFEKVTNSLHPGPAPVPQILEYSLRSFEVWRKVEIRVSKGEIVELHGASAHCRLGVCFAEIYRRTTDIRFLSAFLKICDMVTHLLLVKGAFERADVPELFRTESALFSGLRNTV